MNYYSDILQTLLTKQSFRLEEGRRPGCWHRMSLQRRQEQESHSSVSKKRYRNIFHSTSSGNPQ